ncbi:MAG TPA: hypothetical protein VFS57_10900 [Gemmatimonadaceae bacterium]|nr:hypothetical protein [Gemmatimonadaceae bacterium]
MRSMSLRRSMKSSARGALSSLGILLLVSLGGCNWGTRPQSFSPAQGPQGARVAVRVTNEPSDRLGELFASDSVGVTILDDDRHLLRIAWRRVDAMDVSKVGAAYDLRHGEQPDADKRQRLALLSRFPQGLNGDLLARTLALLRQDALREIK